ncbi:MAG: histidine kinase, partial [Bacteroidales bacterium]|nr:histidine kinase [Bacteroidales bacterium]
MTRERKQSLIILSALLLGWILPIVAPAGVCYIVDPGGMRHWAFLTQATMLVGPMAVIFFVSFYVLVPYLFSNGHKFWYFLTSLLLILVLPALMLRNDVSMLDDVAQTGYYSWAGSLFTIGVFVEMAALGLRLYLQSEKVQQQLEEERRKSTEAELTWLKNQLNPHFLFNSLNNISSLTQIDPDMAQEAIGQLSDLLRYALYESNKPQVPLAGEVEFMHNYISMMRLRCTSYTVIIEELPEHPSQKLQIAPLLFTSFIENAFKHGTSNSQPSSIRIELKADDSHI